MNSKKIRAETKRKPPGPARAHTCLTFPTFLKHMISLNGKDSRGITHSLYKDLLC
jgi:hypothetical protein